MSKARAKKKQRQRSRAAAGAQAPAGVAAGGAAGRAAQRAAARDARTGPGERRPSRLQERDGVTRPDPPWAPFPLTEIGMAAGIVLFGIGFANGGPRGPHLLTIGAALLAIVTAELCLREHFAGFRSHSILLGLLPVTVVHMLVYYAITPSWRGPVALAVDLSLAGAIAWWLQRRFRVVQARAQLAVR